MMKNFIIGIALGLILFSCSADEIDVDVTDPTITMNQGIESNDDVLVGTEVEFDIVLEDNIGISDYQITIVPDQMLSSANILNSPATLKGVKEFYFDSKTNNYSPSEPFPKAEGKSLHLTFTVEIPYKTPEAPYVLEIWVTDKAGNWDKSTSKFMIMQVH